MDVKQATKAYEIWLGERIPLLKADLRLKHQRMRQSPLPFLRATFYRWVQLWPQACPELRNAPELLGVGDLHIENFGTWRDSEGRLVWGVNDFDEVSLIPYAADLVRLGVSAQLAIRESHLSCDPDDALDAILAGYREGLLRGGAPFVLAEQHCWLRDLAISELRDPVAYWQKLDQLPTVRTGLPAVAKAALNQALPEPRLPCRIVHRRAGLGSLGRQRFTALAEWRGGRIAREAKELTASVWQWEEKDRQSARIRYQWVIDRAVRMPDPFVSIHQNWLIRRLAPDCTRLDLASIPKLRNELRLLRAMGWETANIHLGTNGTGDRVLKDLKKRPARWLRRAAEAMAKATLRDWKDWIKS